jgi:hypothetical protein
MTTLPKLMTPAEVTHELKGLIESEELGAVLQGLSRALADREDEARRERCSEYADVVELVRCAVPRARSCDIQTWRLSHAPHPTDSSNEAV